MAWKDNDEQREYAVVMRRRKDTGAGGENMNYNICRRAGFAFMAAEIAFFVMSLTEIGSLLGHSGNLLLSQLAVLIPGVIFVLIDRRNVYEKIRLKLLSFPDIVLCLLYFVLMRKVVEMVNFLTLFFTENRSGTYIFEMVKQTPAWLCILLVGVMPAIGEELLFRGVLYNSFKKVNPLAAMLVSAILFGVLHGNINQFLYAMVAGVMFVLIMEATDSLIAPSIIHCAIDMLSIVAVVIATKTLDNETLDTVIEEATRQSTKEELLQSLPEQVIWGTLCLFAALILIRFIAGKNGRWGAICGLFSIRSKKDSDKSVKAADENAVDGEGTDIGEAEETLLSLEDRKEMVPKCSIFTGPLIAGTVIGIIYMLLVEWAYHLGA